MASELNDANFEQILKDNSVVVVDFWAAWCGPCRAIAPIIEELAEEFKDKALVGKLDVDHNPETAMKHKVRSIPTILFFKDGQVVDVHVGATSRRTLLGKLAKLV